MNKILMGCMCCFSILLSTASKAQQISPLTIGDSVPDAIWQLPLNVVNHQDDVIALKSYRNKLLIIDFWATWCGPCVISLDKLDSIQKELGEELVVVPVTYEPADKVNEFVAKRDWSLFSGVTDTLLSKFFPHRTVPHQVWIQDGKLLAITGAGYASKSNIKQVMARQPVVFEMKEEDMGYDPEKLVEPLKSGFFESSITGQVKSAGSEVKFRSHGALYYNTSLLQLLGQASKYPYSYFWNRYVFDLPDSIRVRVFPRSLRGALPADYFLTDIELMKTIDDNLYTYNFRSNSPVSRELVLKKMKEDVLFFLEANLGVHVRSERRSVQCLVIEKISPIKDHVALKEPYVFVQEDKPFRDFFSNLAGMNRHYHSPIILNETNFDGKVSIKLTCELSDIENVKRQLPAFGFQLRDTVREIEMMVIARQED